MRVREGTREGLGGLGNPAKLSCAQRGSLISNLDGRGGIDRTKMTKITSIKSV